MICQHKIQRKEGVFLLSNNDLRTFAKEKGVRFWEVAEKLHISDPTMSRRLRHELPAADKQEIVAVIDQIAAEKKKSA